MWRMVIILLITVTLVTGIAVGSHTSATLELPGIRTHYFDLTVSPAEVSASIGEQIEIRCSIYSLINCIVKISSVDVLLFDSCDHVVREQRMTKDSYWSFHTAYTIIGDEAYYQIKVNFWFISLSESGRYIYSVEHTEYGADSFPIVVKRLNTAKYLQMVLHLKLRSRQSNIPMFVCR
jgi:hypothetical protein